MDWSDVEFWVLCDSNRVLSVRSSSSSFSFWLERIFSSLDWLLFRGFDTEILFIIERLGLSCFWDVWILFGFIGCCDLAI